ncbi:MAG: 30S ribosomal protein S20 [Candidatus Omnitrophica bacterium]|nr:30S ribosomal protein S20 [Candidatus Omnitrophota bacterium]
MVKKKTSILKRQRQEIKRRGRNKAEKSRIKELIKKTKISVTENKPEYQDIFKKAVKEIDKAASKKILHKRTAARKKSRLQRFVNKLTTKVP